MSRRIEIQLTSERADGVWTWRAAGAKQPKGELDGGLLFSGAKVGDVVRADADFDIDGISVTAVLPPKGARKEPERLEVVGTPQKVEPVTSTLVKRGGEDRGRDRRDRPGRGRPDRGRDRGERSDRDRDRGREGAGGKDEARRDRRPRPERDESKRPPRKPRVEEDTRPKPKRLKAGRSHRNAVLAELPPEQRPVAEQVLRGGLPAVRQAVDKQNESAAAEGRPPVKAEPLLALAEQMLPRLRAAEWRDRAEAALADVNELDLRDLRSVIVAADTAARDDEARALADQLRTALTRRVEQEHNAWLAEIASTLADGRCVRALRLSSRPPKAGAPLPSDMASRLADATAASLNADATQDRWTTVLDALAFSPVRLNVVPESLPAEPGDALLAEVARLATQIPQIATVFGVEPASTSKRPRPRPPRPDRRGPKKVPPPPGAPEGASGAEDRSPGPPAEPAEAPDASTDGATDAAAPEAASAPPGAASSDPVEAAGDEAGASPEAEAPDTPTDARSEADTEPEGPTEPVAAAADEDDAAPDEVEAPAEPSRESSPEPNGENSAEPNGEDSAEPNGEDSAEPNGEDSAAAADPVVEA